MEKRDALAFCAHAWRLIDQTEAGVTTATECSVKVVDGEADVMDSSAAPGDELPDRRVRAIGLEELDERLSGLQSRDSGAVGVLEVRIWQSKDVSTEGKEVADGPQRDSHVGDSRSAAFG